MFLTQLYILTVLAVFVYVYLIIYAKECVFNTLILFVVFQLAKAKKILSVIYTLIKKKIIVCFTLIAMEYFCTLLYECAIFSRIYKCIYYTKTREIGRSRKHAVCAHKTLIFFGWSNYTFFGFKFNTGQKINFSFFLTVI